MTGKVCPQSNFRQVKEFLQCMMASTFPTVHYLWSGVIDSTQAQEWNGHFGERLADMFTLRKFSPDEIRISKHEAWTILTYFWPWIRLKESDLTEADLEFSQGVFLEAIDASYAMGYTQIMFETFVGKIPGSFTDIESMIKTFVKKAAKHWFKHLGKKSLDDAQIYSSIKFEIAGSFKSTIASRRETGEY